MSATENSYTFPGSNNKLPKQRTHLPQSDLPLPILKGQIAKFAYYRLYLEVPGELRGDIFGEMGEFWAEIAGKSHTEIQIQFLTSELKRGGYVLDIACGTGRHTIALCELGFDLVGLDISANLLKIAKKHGASMLVRGDMHFLPFKSGSFTAAVSMDNSFGYLPSEKEDVESLAEAKSVLNRDGVFVLDVFNREKLAEKYRLHETSKLYDYPSFTLNQERTVSADGTWLCDRWTVKQYADGQEQVFEHKARLYTRDRLEVMINKAGFYVEKVFGDYDQKPFSAVSPRLIIKASAT